MRKRERRARKRREKGVRTREAYLDELASKPRPWTVQGISRSAYYRKRKRDEVCPELRRGEFEIIVFKQRTHVVSPNVGGLRKEGHQRSVSGESPKQITREAKRAETKASCSPELRTDFVSIELATCCAGKLGCGGVKLADLLLQKGYVGEPLHRPKETIELYLYFFILAYLIVYRRRIDELEAAEGAKSLK